MKKSRFLLGLLPALLLGMFVVPSAMADGLDEHGALNATDTKPVQAAITKVFQTPVGTIMPDLTFHFQISAVSIDGDTSNRVYMPSLGPVTLSTSTMTALDPTGDTLSYYAESDNIFDGAIFPYAGIYVYTVTENADTNPVIISDSFRQVLTYSQASYQLTVYVSNLTDGAGTYIYSLTTEKVTNDAGADGGNVKVDPTPGGDGADTTYSQMTFTNTYVKTNGSQDPLDPDPIAHGTLSVSKQVSGVLASTEVYFPFTIKVAPPSLASQLDHFIAYIVEGRTVVDDIALNTATGTLTGTSLDSNQHRYISFSANVPTNFSLKAGQSLVFVDTPVGTNYDVTEQASTGYEPSLVVTTNGLAAAAIDNGVNASVSATGQLVGEGLNNAAVTNLRNFVTPTGLSMGSLPFVGVMALAVMGIIGFTWFTIRSKRRATA